MVTPEVFWKVTPLRICLTEQITPCSCSASKLIIWLTGIYRDEEKLTPTHVAVIRGNAKVLQLLLRNGGDPTKKDEVSISP